MSNTRTVTIDYRLLDGTAYADQSLVFTARPGQTSGGSAVATAPKTATTNGSGLASVVLTTGVRIVVRYGGNAREIVVPDGGDSVSFDSLLAASAEPTDTVLAEIEAQIAAHNASTSAHAALTAFTGREVTGDSTTLTAADDRKFIHCNRGAGVAVTLPNNLPVGFATRIIQTGAGQVTFSAAPGATLRHEDDHTKTRKQYSPTSVEVIANSGGSSAVWLLSGSTAA